MIKIALAQIKSFHGDPELNLKKAIKLIEEASNKKVNIIIFPELYYSGYFNRRKKFYEISETKEEFHSKLKNKAKEHNISIIMGYPEKEGEKYYNSIIYIDEDGKLLCSYRKIYCWKEEKRTFEQGDKLFVVDTKFGKIGLLSCYDVEFPELFRILHFKGAKLVICPAVWSEWIGHRWDSSLMAGAINNLYFVVGVNTVGPTPLNKELCGNSQVISPFGEVVVRASSKKEEVIYCEINLEEVEEIRKEYPIWQDYREDMFDKNLIKKY